MSEPLSKNKPVNITAGFAFTLVGILYLAINWKKDIEHNNKDIQTLLNTVIEENWTQSDMRLYSSRAETLNPGWVAPKSKLSYANGNSDQIMAKADAPIY